MTTYWSLLQLVLPVFALIALGAGLRRAGWLTREADESLLRMVVNFLYPCLIFANVAGNAALREPGNLLFAPMAGFVTIAFGIGLAYQVGRALGLAQGTGLRTFAFATGIYNYGYMAVPLVDRLFGPGALGVLMVHNVGCEVAIWTVGILVLSGLSVREGWRRLFNPPVLALLAAVAVNLLGWSGRIPAVAQEVIRLSADCAVPLGLLLIGATLVEFIARPRELVEPRVTIASVLLRLGVLPLCFLLFASWLPFPVELKRVIVVQAAMPAGILPIVIARHYGGRPLTAVQVVVATTVLGIFLIPFWLRLGLAWLGV